MLFALHTPYNTFCKDDLMIDNWAKHVVKGEKKTNNVVFD